MKLLLEISYLGSSYHGYQVQPHAPTIQGTLQSVLESFYKTRLMLTGCSRTDAGVHARQFFLTVEGAPSGVPADRLPYALASLLPPDITVRSARVVDDYFHARYDVKYKEYEYLIWNEPLRSPFYDKRAWHYPRTLDVGLMNKAAKILTGEHDFAAFMAQGSPVKSTVREIYAFDCRREQSLVIIRVSANGFLYNMVRILAGTLVNVSEDRIGISDISRILASGDRSLAGMTLPPDGLYLNRVCYRDDVSDASSRTEQSCI